MWDWKNTTKRWRDALNDMLVLASSSGTLNAPLYRKIAECYRHLGEDIRAHEKGTTISLVFPI